MVLPEQYYYQGSSTDGVIISKKKHKLIICKHDGGSSYLMGLVTNGSFVSILGNGNDFSVTVKNREITVISTAPYWYVLLIWSILLMRQYKISIGYNDAFIPNTHSSNW